MQDGQRVAVASRVAYQVSDDGQFVALIFDTATGPLSVAVPSANATMMVRLMIEACQDIGAKVQSPVPSGSITSHPIDVASLGVTMGRTESEAILAANAGPLTLTFATPLSTLIDILQKLQTMTIRGQASKLQ